MLSTGYAFLEVLTHQEVRSLLSLATRTRRFGNAMGWTPGVIGAMILGATMAAGLHNGRGGASPGTDRRHGFRQATVAEAGGGRYS